MRQHRQFAAEVAALVTVFTPLTRPADRAASATSRETFGAIALSKPLDACSLAVTLAHEVQHAKLSALIDIVPMTQPDDGSLHYAPWREDPRPAAGLIQGTYAFLGVTAFWRRQREVAVGAAAIKAHAEFAHWQASVVQAAQTLLASGRLTDAGETFVTGIAQTLRTWASDQIPADAAAIAATAAEEHRRLWQTRNSDLASSPLTPSSPG